MKYFIYCPFEFNQAEAYHLVQTYLENGQIVTLYPNKVTKHAVGFSRPATTRYDTYLMEVSDTGEMRCIDQKGFD